MAAKKVYAALDMRSNKINSVGNPTAAQDAATKNYVDNLALGGDLTGTPAAATVAKLNGVTVTGTPTLAQVLRATSTTAATWQTLAAATIWEPLTNGSPASPELIFDGTGDVIMVEV